MKAPSAGAVCGYASINWRYDTSAAGTTRCRTGSVTFTSSRSSMRGALRQGARRDVGRGEVRDDLVEIRPRQLRPIGLPGLLHQVGHAQQRVGRRRVLRIGRTHVGIRRQRGVDAPLSIVDARDEQPGLRCVRARGPLTQRALQAGERGVELPALHGRQRRFDGLGDRVRFGSRRRWRRGRSAAAAASRSARRRPAAERQASGAPARRAGLPAPREPQAALAVP